MAIRILYECSDYPHASGGVRRLYRHVDILRRHGLDAVMLHHKLGFRPAWFAHDVPIEYWTEDFRFTPDDILVIPEGHAGVMRRTVDCGCERVVIALNWANIYKQLEIGTDWRTFGITHVIAGSQYEQHFVRQSMGLDSTVLASGTDTDLFKETGPKALQIAYMPRKNPKVFQTIAGIFRSRFPEWAHVPFVSIDEVPHDEVAHLMSASAIFLATSYPEGLARPPLEAMASGCIVVGFAGRGSLEYMHHGVNCYRADDLDMLTAAEYLDLALRSLADSSAAAMKAAARETATRYTLEREEAAVTAYWQSMLAARQPQTMNAACQ